MADLTDITNFILMCLKSKDFHRTECLIKVEAGPGLAENRDKLRLRERIFSQYELIWDK